MVTTPALLTVALDTLKLAAALLLLVVVLDRSLIAATDATPHVSSSHARLSRQPSESRSTNVFVGSDADNNNEAASGAYPQLSMTLQNTPFPASAGQESASPQMASESASFCWSAGHESVSAHTMSPQWARSSVDARGNGGGMVVVLSLIHI